MGVYDAQNTMKSRQDQHFLVSLFNYNLQLLCLNVNFRFTWLVLRIGNFGVSPAYGDKFDVSSTL